MLRSMICSRSVTVVWPFFSDGMITTLGSTEGTCTVAKSISSFPFLVSFLERSAPIFNVLLRIRGNGLEESIAIGVRTGYTLSSKYWSTNSFCFSENASCSKITWSPAFSSAGTRDRFNVLYCTWTRSCVCRLMAFSCSLAVIPAISVFLYPAWTWSFREATRTI